MGFMGSVINRPVPKGESQLQLHLIRTAPNSSECTLTGAQQPKVPAILRDLEDLTNCLLAG